MGDFNLHIDWANQISHNAVEEEFLECIRDGFLDQYVEEPTREQPILDWVLCSEKRIISLAVRNPWGISEYDMIAFFIMVESEVVDVETKVLNLNKGNYGDMRQVTNQIPEMVEHARFSEREEFREINISREMVLGRLMGLKVDKSLGPDDLRAYKGLSPEIVDALVVIFQDPIDSNIIPIFKKG
eukprot:g31943.t1